MKLAAFALAALAVPAAAMAQDQASADLIAKFMMGAEEGATFVLDVDFSQILLERRAPGSYGGQSKEGDFAFAITEGEKCIFEITITYGETPDRLTFDANQLASITYTPNTTLEGDPPLSDYVLDFKGGGRLFTLPDYPGADGRPSVGQSQLWIMTSVPLNELEDALAVFRSDYCPGLDS